MNRKEHFLICKMTLKRLMARKSFWVILILLPILLFGVAKLESSSSGVLSAVVYCREEALNPLLEESESPRFYFASSEEEVKEQVLLGKAECGYVIPEDLFEAFEGGDWYWKVDVYEGSHSMLTKLINEVLFSRIFEAVSVNWYEAFVEEKTAAERFDVSKDISDKLTEIFESGETFRIETIRLTDETEEVKESVSQAENDEKTGAGRISAKAVVAVMLYLVSLLAVMDVVKDREKRHFRAGMHLSAAFWTIFHPVMLVGASGLVTLLLTDSVLHGGRRGTVGNVLSDIMSYILLLLIIVIYALVLSFCLRKADRMYGLIPVFFVAGLVCCPVFVDLSMFFPIFGWIKWLFPFAFYL